jgi:hypothetical protein
MTKNGMKVLESDIHLMEPVDLWDRYIDSQFKAIAPRGLTSENVVAFFWVVLAKT